MSLSQLGIMPLGGVPMLAAVGVQGTLALPTVLWKRVIQGGGQGGGGTPTVEVTEAHDHWWWGGEGTRSGSCPENAIIVRRDTPVDVQNEDRFSPVNSFAFSPLSPEYMTIENAVLLAAVWQLSRKDPKVLARLTEKYISNVTDLLQTILQSGKTHPLTGLNAQTVFACVAHRFGVITDAHYLKIADQTRNLIDKGVIQLDWIGKGLTGLETLVESAQVGSMKGVPALANLNALRSR